MTYNTKADVFSYGIVLFEIITRKKVKDEVQRNPKDAFELNFDSILPHIPTDCPTGFPQLLFDCCTYEPENRPDFKAIVRRLKEVIKEIEEQEEKSKLEKEAGEEEQVRLNKLERDSIGRTTIIANKRIPTPQITSKFTTITHSPSSIKIISKITSRRNSGNHDLHRKEISQSVLLHNSSQRDSKEQKRRSTGSSHKSEEGESIPEPPVSIEINEVFRQSIRDESGVFDINKTNTITDLFRAKLATTKSELPKEQQSLERNRNSVLEEELPPKPSLLSGFVFFGKYKFR